MTLLGWLQRASDLDSERGEAYCKLCKTALRAHKTDLMKHSKTKIHTQKANSLNVKKTTSIDEFWRVI